MLVSTNLHQCVDINESNLMSPNPWIYTDGPILRNLHRWVDIDKPSPLSQYWYIYVEELISANQYWTIYLNKSISKNLHQWVNIKNVCLWADISKSVLYSSHGCFFTKVSMLMNLNLQVNIDESTQTGRYWWICSFKEALMNLHLSVNINESRPMG